MSIFLHILSNNIVPIFTIIALGFILSKKFDFNIYTLSKMNFYLFTPTFIFVNLYTAELDMDMIKVLFFCIIYLVINDLLARITAKVRKYDIGLTNAFKNSIMFNNSGNIGLSLITLVFSSAPFVVDGKTPYLGEAIAAQIIILVFMNLTMNTIGFYNAGRASMNFKDSIKQIFSLPSIYAIPLAILFRSLELDITVSPLWPALTYIKNGLVPISLITLGVQLSKTEFNFRDMNVHIAVFARLVLGPILALVFIYLFGFTGAVAQTVLIAYSVPTAVNTALIAVECDSNKDFASQMVMLATIFSAITLTLAIYAARILFPV
ncbi:MAG TPA: AEC family transporter [Patescibacteria group bacterium]|nr:AEC family transporter [Patescibacteria group bacterium]